MSLSRREMIVATAGMACLLAAVHGPALVAGFQLINDHEIFWVNAEVPPHPQAFKAYTLGESIAGVDLSWGRFRPLCRVWQFGMLTLLGDGSAAWHAAVALTGLATAGLLYAASRVAGLGKGPSLVVIGTVFLHPEASTTWTKITNPEAPGALFMGLSLLAIAQAAGRQDARKWDALLVAGALIAALMKESFILTVPALAFARVALWAQRRDCGWFAALRRNLAPVAGLGVVCLLSLAGVLWAVSRSGGESYGGQSLQMASLSGRVAAAVPPLGRRGWPLPAAVALVVMAFRLARGANRAALRTFLYAALFSGLWIGPQVLLHAGRGGMVGHYWMPAVVGMAGANGMGLHWLAGLRPRWPYRAALLSAFVWLAAASRDAAWYASKYLAGTRALGAMIEYIGDETPREAPLVIAADPAADHERALSLIAFVGHAGRGDLPVYLLEILPDAPYAPRAQRMAEELRTVCFAGRRDLSAITPKTLGGLILLVPPERLPEPWRGWMNSGALRLREFRASWRMFHVRRLRFHRGEAVFSMLLPGDAPPRTDHEN